MQFRTEIPAEQRPIGARPFHIWQTPEGDAVADFHRMQCGFFIRFPRRADFRIDFAQDLLSCTPHPEASAAAIEALYRNQVAPLVQAHGGVLVLHAAAIATARGALAFAAWSGRGKSTLAAAFASAGHPFLADDGLVLEPAGERYLAVPSQPSVRLWQDSETAIFPMASPDEASSEKSLLGASASLPHQRSSLPLQCTYVLGDGRATRTAIRRLGPAEALAALLRHAFVLDVDDRARLREHFRKLAELSDTTPVFSLDYPRRHEDLPALVRTILDHAEEDIRE